MPVRRRFWVRGMAVAGNCIVGVTKGLVMILKVLAFMHTYNLLGCKRLSFDSSLANPWTCSGQSDVKSPKREESSNRKAHMDWDNRPKIGKHHHTPRTCCVHEIFLPGIMRLSVFRVDTRGESVRTTHPDHPLMPTFSSLLAKGNADARRTNFTEREKTKFPSLSRWALASSAVS